MGIGIGLVPGCLRSLVPHDHDSDYERLNTLHAAKKTRYSSDSVVHRLLNKH